MYTDLLNLMGMMLLMIICGLVLHRQKLITEAGKKSLVNLIIYLLLPCNIIKAFCMELSMEELKEMSTVLVLSMGIQLFYVLVTRTAYRHFPEEERPVYQYATVCSNAGFLGNPISQGVFGDLGLLYTSVFLIPQRIVMWTAGVSFFAKPQSRLEVLRKVLLHPCIIAVGIGMVIFLLQIQLPPVVDSTVTSFSRCCTGMTMVYIGTVLAGVDYRTLVSGRQIFFAVLRLAVIPGLVYGFCQLIHAAPLVTGVCVLMSAMPAGNTTAILASKYGADEETAVRCVVFTTALSLISTPLWSMLLTAAL